VKGEEKDYLEILKYKVDLSDMLILDTFPNFKIFGREYAQGALSHRK